MKNFAVAILTIIVLTGTVAAQLETTEGRFAGALILEYPSDWRVQSKDGLGYFFETDSSIMRVRLYDTYVQNYFRVDIGDLEHMMQTMVNDIFETRNFDEQNVHPIKLGDIEGIAYAYEERYEGRVYTRQIFLKPLTKGLIAAANIESREGTTLNQIDVENLIQVLSTVELTSRIEFYEGTSLDVPDGWSITGAGDENFAYVWLEDGSLELRLELWPGYGGMVGLENASDFYAFNYDYMYRHVEPLNRTEFQSIRVSGHDAIFDPVRTRYFDDNGRLLRGFVALVLPNNSGFIAAIYSNDATDSIESAYEVLDTLNAGRRFVCPLFPEAGTRIREDASTAANIVRETEGETLVALEAVRDSNGYLWFDVGEGFIRSDVVYHETRVCSTIPGY